MKPISTSSPGGQAQPSTASRRWVSPKRLLIILVATIFSAELLLMSALHFLNISPLLEIVIDSTMLVLLLMPVLLRTVVHPMQSKIQALAEAEQSLRQASAELEMRVQERTLALSSANEALQREIEERSRMQEDLRRLSETDALTGLLNRRAFESLAEHEFKRSERYGEALSLIMFDIDYFKRINDTFGHHIGDEVLVEVSRLICDRIRSCDLFARWGGEEFILLAPNTNLENTVILANQLRSLMEGHTFKEVGTVTASLGVTQFTKGDGLDNMLQRADKALYRAKHGGRNRVEDEPYIEPVP